MSDKNTKETVVAADKRRDVAIENGLMIEYIPGQGYTIIDLGPDEVVAETRRSTKECLRRCQFN